MKLAHGILAPLVILFVVLAIACGRDDGGSAPTVASTQADAEETSTATVPPAPVVTKASGELILATTTSTQDSGLLDVLVPMFEDETGYDVQTIAVGSGQAIAQGARGDADVILAHSPAAEQKMVADGDGVERALVMHNDFIIVGPEDDPAGVAQQESIGDALRAIASTGAAFISRGDDSGTHVLELKLWQSASIDPSGEGWYVESGQGMGATLQIANQRQAYTISDRGTYLSQQENLDLSPVYEGDPALLNVYHVIVVNPEKHVGVNAAAARAFAAFITRADVQAIIGDFGIDEFGEPLFFPDAGKPEPTS